MERYLSHTKSDIILNVTVYRRGNTNTKTNTISLSPPEALSEGEKAELIRQGVPEDYIERQSPRAVVYANREKPLSEILWEWWQKDRRTPKPRAAPVRSVSENKSYDLDEFWQAALERSETMLMGQAPPL